MGTNLSCNGVYIMFLMVWFDVWGHYMGYPLPDGCSDIEDDCILVEKGEETLVLCSDRFRPADSFYYISPDLQMVDVDGRG